MSRCLEGVAGEVDFTRTFALNGLSVGVALHEACRKPDLERPLFVHLAVRRVNAVEGETGTQTEQGSGGESDQEMPEHPTVPMMCYEPGEFSRQDFHASSKLKRA